MMECQSKLTHRLPLVVASRFEYNEPSRTTDVAICAGVLAVHFKIMVNIQISMKDGKSIIGDYITRMANEDINGADGLS